MSKPKLIQLEREIDMLMNKFHNNHFLMAEAFLQLIHRENIIATNRLRKKYGEPEKIPDPVMYSETGGYKRVKVEWVIDVPKEWISETGRY